MVRISMVWTLNCTVAALALSASVAAAANVTIHAVTPPKVSVHTSTSMPKLVGHVGHLNPQAATIVPYCPGCPHIRLPGGLGGSDPWHPNGNNPENLPSTPTTVNTRAFGPP